MQRAVAHRLHACVLVATLGCGNTATLRRWNGPDVEARIAGSDERFFYLEANGSTHPVPRADVWEIDHPGDVELAVAGGMSLLFGLPLAIIAGQEPDQRDQILAAAAVLVLPFAIWALVSGEEHLRSSRAAGHPTPPIVLPPGADRPPLAGTDRHGGRP